MVTLSVDNDDKKGWGLHNLNKGSGSPVKNNNFVKYNPSAPKGNSHGDPSNSLFASMSRKIGLGPNAGKRQALPPEKLNIREHMDRLNSRNSMPESNQPSDLEMLIEELLGQTKEGHTWESRAQDEDMINQIFGAELAKIAGARTASNERATTAKAETQNLYSGHENEIRTKDKAAYQGIATDQANATNQIYDSGVGQMQAGQNANREASIEMMNRLGLQASAPLAQETANQSQDAINSLVTAKTQQQAQNQSYASADMRANDGRAQSIADEGVAQQADLTRQLQEILGGLDSKEADVNSKRAEAMMGAYQRSEDNWRGDRDYATSALAALMEAQAEAAGKAQEIQQSNAPQMQNILNGLGINDPGLQSQYSSAYTDAMLNANYVPGGARDEKTAYLKYLVGNDEYDSLDPNLLQQLITGNLNYGSYKVGAPTG